MASSKKPRHAELPAKLETFLDQTARPGQRLLLGFSGGLDSCVLLHLLAGFRASHGYELTALHVNHGLSPNADDWQRFCAGICVSFEVPFSAARVAVPRDSGLGIEAAARAARYRVLLAHPADHVMLAHHRDDQAETLLLQLLRGAGVRGLAAMAGQQTARPARILRPLLDIPRVVLEDYARAHALRWIEDESNLDLAYDRNFLRHRIFPELECRFSASRATFARAAAHLAEAAALLDEVAREDAVHWVSQGRLEIAGLRAMSVPRAKNLLRVWLSDFLDEPPSARRLQEMLRQLLEARAEARVAIAVGAGVVHRYRDAAWFEPTASGEPAGIEGAATGWQWRGEDELRLPGGYLRFSKVTGAGLSQARLAGQLLDIRYRAGGERMRLFRGGSARSLKNLFQEAGIPAWQRPSLPLVFWRGQLVAVPGIGIDAEWQAGPGEAGVTVDWCRA